MSQPFNLDEVDDSQELILDGNRYIFNYPTTEQVLEAEKLKTRDEQMEFVYGLVTPVDPASPSFKDALSKQSIKKAMKFMELVERAMGMSGE